MFAKSTLGFLALTAAFAAGALERDRILPSSTRISSREAVRPPAPLPPVRPEADPAPAAAPTAVAALEPPGPPSAAPPPPPARMSLTQEADFDAWMVKTYLGCWKPAPQPADVDAYVAQVRLAFKPDGSLRKPPKLINPPSDPASKPQAKSVMQAVKACDPLRVPTQYRPFYEQWKTKTIHFNPQIATR